MSSAKHRAPWFSTPSGGGAISPRTVVAPAGRGARRREDALLARFDDRPQLRFLPPDLSGGVALRELGRLEHLPDLHLGAAVEGRALQPLDRLFLRLALPEPEAGDQLLRLGKGPVGDSALLAVEAHPRAVLAGVQALARQHHAGLDQLLVELPHLGQDLLVGKSACFRVLVGLDDHHESHLVSPVGAKGVRDLRSTLRTKEDPPDRHAPSGRAKCPKAGYSPAWRSTAAREVLPCPAKTSSFPPSEH